MKSKQFFIMTITMFILFKVIYVYGEIVTVPVKVGWSAFGVPVYLENPSILNYIQPDQVEVIKKMEDGNWIYFRNKDSDDFKAFEPGQGYMIKAKKSFTITFEGYLKGYPLLKEGKNFVSLPVHKVTTAQQLLEKFIKYNGSIKWIAAYDGPWGLGWGIVDGSKFDTFSELETHRGYFVNVEEYGDFDLRPPEMMPTFWAAPYESMFNLLFNGACDNFTDETKLRYSVYLTDSSSGEACLEDLDKREPRTDSPCYVKTIISKQIPEGEWDICYRGEELQYLYNKQQITADVINLQRETVYYFTIVVEDENGNKSQYDIVQTKTYDEHGNPYNYNK